MENDKELRDNILAELAFEPSIDATQIGVTMKNGVATLSGDVTSYAQKRAAEQAATRVRGVRAVAEDIQIKTRWEAKDDSGLALDAANALKWSHTLPKDQVKLKVENGFAYLDGQVDREYEKWAAKNAIANVHGIKSVIDRVTVKSPINTGDVKTQIRSALERSARFEANGITVDSRDHEVTLKGKVHSWAEADEAKSTAMRAQGVWSVKNELEVV